MALCLGSVSEVGLGIDVISGEEVLIKCVFERVLGSSATFFFLLSPSRACLCLVFFFFCVRKL